MEPTTPISCEHDLPRPVRAELRSLEEGLTEGLVEELLVSLGVPVAEAED